MAAIEFAVKYDDGVGAGLHEADIVLVGVSRTSKTPLSMYLGYLGYKTANVPVVKGIEPPSALFHVDPTKVVGLTIDAQRLQEIRQPARGQARRQPAWLCELLEIYAELEQAEADPPAARLPRDRDLRAIDRGDGSAGDQARRAAARRGRLEGGSARLVTGRRRTSRCGGGRSGGRSSGRRSSSSTCC